MPAAGFVQQDELGPVARARAISSRRSFAVPAGSCHVHGPVFEVHELDQFHGLVPHLLLFP